MVNVIIATDPRYSINKQAIENIVISTLRSNNISKLVEVEVNIVGDRKMLELNKKYRNLNYPANILTFVFEDSNPSNNHHIAGVGFVASPDNILRLGSIIISYPRALEDAGIYQKSVEEEICFLVEHGTCHLLGLHHMEN